MDFQPPKVTSFSDETKLALTLARKGFERDLSMVRTEASDYQRERDRCLEALRQVYTEFGEDPRISEICDPLITEFNTI